MNFKIYALVKIRVKHPLLNNVYRMSMYFYLMTIIPAYFAFIYFCDLRYC